MPDGDRYHHQFRYRTKDGTEFTKLVEIDTLELKKLPPEADNTELWYWMKFIKSDDEGVLDMLAQQSRQMRKAVGVLKELSADERTRMLYEKREMARMDIESIIRMEWQGVVAEKDAAFVEQGRGVVFGKEPIALPSDFDTLLLKWREGELSAREVALLCGISERTLYKKTQSLRSR